MFIVKNHDKNYAEIEKTKNNYKLGKQEIFFTEKEIFLEIKDYLLYKCEICSKNYGTSSELEEHLDKTHKLFLCQVCLGNRKIIIEKLLYYSKEVKSIKNSRN